IWGSGPSDVYAVGQIHKLTGTPLYVYHYDGLAWGMPAQNPDPGGTMPALHGVWGTDASHIWVVGEGGTVLFWDGNAWNALLTGAGGTETLSAIWGSNPRDLWIAGSAGVRHFNGTMWMPLGSLSAPVTIWLSPN